MKAEKNTRIKLGGFSAFNWRIFALSLPIILFETPLSEVGIGNGWVFWRWTFATLLSILPLITLYALGDFFFFQNRIENPIKDWILFAYGFLMGAVFGVCMGALTYALHLQNDNLVLQILQRGLSNGLAGMLLLPFSSLITHSIEIYKSDREVLIAERMLVESQKAESKAVIQSLRSSLSNKVDENLLNIIENSKEYFNSKSRSLEENWELLAERLRRAALDTIRPFSHSLHRKGEELTYGVKLNELASYIAYKFDIHVLLTLLVYVITSHHRYINSDFQFEYIRAFFLKVVILATLLIALKLTRRFNFSRKLGGLLILMSTTSAIFYFADRWLLDYFGWNNENLPSNLSDSIFVSFLIVLISLCMAFVNGGHAEIEFLERRISEEQLETMLLRREEARISRELAKYLHGTIQSRLMASAIGLESAGKRGDIKALQKEAKTAYRNLKLPSESYFSAPESTLKAEIEKVIKKWQNLLTIKLKIQSNTAKLSADLIQDLGNAINEALSNAFRHGQADQLNIKIEFIKGQMIVEISDNGSGPTKGKGGLGSEWFDAIAGKNWQLKENSKGGSTLELVIKVR